MVRYFGKPLPEYVLLYITDLIMLIAYKNKCTCTCNVSLGTVKILKE